MSSGLIEIRSGTAADLDVLLALERTIEGAPHWSEAHWLQALAAVSGAGSDESYAGPERHVMLATLDGSIVGFLVQQMVAAIAEIESLAVAKAHRRLGVGRQLVLSSLALAKRRAARSVELEVRASNHAAQELYRSLGFHVEGARLDYYREPVEDAMLLRRLL
jgi:ribosomal-protein-alanine N-acetyltransferase